MAHVQVDSASFEKTSNRHEYAHISARRCTNLWVDGQEWHGWVTMHLIGVYCTCHSAQPSTPGARLSCRLGPPITSLLWDWERPDTPFLYCCSSTLFRLCAHWTLPDWIAASSLPLHPPSSAWHIWAPLPWGSAAFTAFPGLCLLSWSAYDLLSCASEMEIFLFSHRHRN